MNLKKELKHILKGEVKDDERTRKKYSRDASLFRVRPSLVVYPRDAEDVKALVRFVAGRPEEKLSLTCRAGGSDMTGGPLTESIVVDMKHLNRLCQIGLDPGGEGGWARVQPGMFYRDFEAETLKRGLLLPSFPASRDLCAVGGMVANNAGGEKTLRYGKTEDYILELKAVLRDGQEHVIRPLRGAELSEAMGQEGLEGEMYRKMYRLLTERHEQLQGARPLVSKNSAGYALWNVWNKETFDLTRLFCGSQGTLGIITEITFRLVEPARHSALLVLFLSDFGRLADAIETVLQEEPETFESYDDHTLKFAVSHLADFVRILKSNVFSLALRFLPEFWMFLKGGFRFPRLVLLAEFSADSQEEAEEKARTAQERVAPLGLQTHVAGSEQEKAKYKTVRRESYNLLRKHVKGKRTAPFIDDLIVRPDVLPVFLPELTAVLSRYPRLVYTIAGHIGDGNFHIIPLMDLRRPENRALIPELARQAYRLAFRYQGSMTAEHNDGIVRTPFLETMYGREVVELFGQVKRLFDPQNMFNPGKKVGGSMEYLTSHIAPQN